MPTAVPSRAMGRCGTALPLSHVHACACVRARVREHSEPTCICARAPVRLRATLGARALITIGRAWQLLAAMVLAKHSSIVVVPCRRPLPLRHRPTRAHRPLALLHRFVCAARQPQYASFLHGRRSRSLLFSSWAGCSRSACSPAFRPPSHTRTHSYPRWPDAARLASRRAVAWRNALPFRHGAWQRNRQQ